MHKNSDLDLINLVVHSELLAKQRASDSDLDAIMRVIEHSLNSRRETKEIHVSAPSGPPASHYEEIYKRRLKLTRDLPEKQQLRKSMSKLLDYLHANPNTQIQIVTINSTHKSYSVFCGILASEKTVISIIEGKTIPEQAFKRLAD